MTPFAEPVCMGGSIRLLPIFCPKSYRLQQREQRGVPLTAYQLPADHLDRHGRHGGHGHSGLA